MVKAYRGRVRTQRKGAKIAKEERIYLKKGVGKSGTLPVFL
jgi:hypothetical protein